jgi:hypothetical protein
MHLIYNFRMARGAPRIIGRCGQAATRLPPSSPPLPRLLHPRSGPRSTRYPCRCWSCPRAPSRPARCPCRRPCRSRCWSSSRWARRGRADGLSGVGLTCLSASRCSAQRSRALLPTGDGLLGVLLAGWLADWHVLIAAVLKSPVPRCPRSAGRRSWCLRAWAWMRRCRCRPPAPRRRSRWPFTR